MTSRCILIVDDEHEIRRAVRTALAADAMRIIEAATGHDAIALATADRPDLIVLDLGLPDLPGRQVCESIRLSLATPILVLSARHSDAEKAAMLDSGADDYVTKPFSTIELQARVRALFRRAARRDSADEPTSIVAGELAIDLLSHSVIVGGSAVHLTPIEWQLLRTLAVNSERTLTHRQLFAAVWPGRTYGDAQHYLRVHMTHLRRKIEREPARPRHVVTELGVGYRFVP